jgi:hypothetical protein
MSSSPQFYVSFGHGLINFNQILNHDDKELFHNVGRELLSHELVTSYIFVQDLKKTGTESLKKKGKKIKEEVLWTPEQKDRDGIQNARREWKKWLGEKDSIAREEWIAESLSFEVELLIDGGSQSLLLYQWLYQDINNNKKVEWSGRLKALQKNARYYLAVSWRNLKSHNDIANHCKLQDEKFNWDGDTEGTYTRII